MAQLDHAWWYVQTFFYCSGLFSYPSIFFFFSNEIEYCPSELCKELCRNFDGDCNESVDCFWQDGHTMFSWYHWKAHSFLKGNGGVVDVGEGSRRRLKSECIVWEKNKEKILLTSFYIWTTLNMFFLAVFLLVFPHVLLGLDMSGISALVDAVSKTFGKLRCCCFPAWSLFPSFLQMEVILITSLNQK